MNHRIPPACGLLQAIVPGSRTRAVATRRNLHGAWLRDDRIDNHSPGRRRTNESPARSNAAPWACVQRRCFVHKNIRIYSSYDVGQKSPAGKETAPGRTLASKEPKATRRPGWVSRASRAVPEGACAYGMPSSEAAFRRKRRQRRECGFAGNEEALSERR